MATSDEEILLEILKSAGAQNPSLSSPLYEIFCLERDKDNTLGAEIISRISSQIISKFQLTSPCFTIDKFKRPGNILMTIARCRQRAI
jgi:hypothetical protein